jgi:tripartite-type tricarboxylate transporter receptor subunit TctC
MVRRLSKTTAAAAIAMATLVAACSGGTGSEAGDPSAGADGAPVPPDGFPRGPITLTVVYPAGGGMDVAARTLASVAEEVTDHEFRVQNREGAAGMVGHTYLAQQSPSDGSEVGLVANLLFDDILLRDAPFTVDDFEPIGFLGFDPLILTVGSEGRVGDVDFEGLVDFARSNPGDLRFGTVPPGMYESALDMFESSQDVTVNRVSYDGGAPGLTDLLGGNIDAFHNFFAEVESHIDAGTVTPVAVLDTERDSRLPDVPSYGDLGIQIESSTYGASRFLTVPPETDEETRAYLEELFAYVLQSEEAEKAFGDIGVPLGYRSAEDTASWFKSTFDLLSEQYGG